MTAGAEEAAGVKAAGKGLAAWTYQPEEAEAKGGEGMDMALRLSLKSRQ